MASALVLIGVLRWATVGYLEQQSSVAIERRACRPGRAVPAARPGRAAVAGQRQGDDQPRRADAVPVCRRAAPAAGRQPDRVPPLTADANGWYDFSGVDADKRLLRMRGGMIVLGGGEYLLVAQDQSRLESIRALIDEGCCLGTRRWSRAGTHRRRTGELERDAQIEAINRTSRQIMTGRLQSRMPVRGVNDEFDQLSENLNAMLDRIDSLIEGVRAVADNIAHDLRTPLTRLRGRLEQLAGRPDLNEELRGELASAMTEADHLLATFRALAAHRPHRVGHPRAGMVRGGSPPPAPGCLGAYPGRRRGKGHCGPSGQCVGDPAG
ncbi:MAG: HAMP domain-containing protein [Rhodopseudomonas palustris]|nr:HAMP domain-containing protein [Rhodopseudomonas palustris]